MMAFVGVLYQAAWRFFTVCSTKLNKGERDQPAPFEVRRAHLMRELEELAEEEQRYRSKFSHLDPYDDDNCYEVNNQKPTE